MLSLRAILYFFLFVLLDWFILLFFFPIIRKVLFRTSIKEDLGGKHCRKGFLYIEKPLSCLAFAVHKVYPILSFPCRIQPCSVHIPFLPVFLLRPYAPETNEIISVVCVIQRLVQLGGNLQLVFNCRIMPVCVVKTHTLYDVIIQRFCFISPYIFSISIFRLLRINVYCSFCLSSTSSRIAASKAFVSLCCL